MLWFSNNRNISGLFNVGTGEARTFKDLALNVYANLDVEPNIGFIDTPNIEETLSIFHRGFIEEASRSWFFRNFTSLEEGAKKYITNFLKTRSV